MTELIKIFGPKRSRAFRVRWACEELGLRYEGIDIDLAAGEGRTREHRERHPLGKVPTVELPGGFRMFESTAIVTHLGDLHPESGLVPRPGTEARALYEQWVAFANTEMDAHLWTRALHQFALPEPERVAEVLPVAEKLFARSCRVVEDALGDGESLLPGGFTAADLVVGQILMWARSGELDIGERLSRYAKNLRARPAFVAAASAP